MRLPSTLASTTLLFALSNPATAGGIGIEMLTGLHSETVSYYDANSTLFNEVQLRPTQGLAFQAILGDRDYELMGLMRVAIFLDAGPTVDVVPPKNYTYYTDEEGEELETSEPSPLFPTSSSEMDIEQDMRSIGEELRSAPEFEAVVDFDYTLLQSNSTELRLERPNGSFDLAIRLRDPHW